MTESAFVTLVLHNQNSQEVKTFKVRSGGNIWAALRKHRMPIGAACSGVGICGACAVQVVEGLEYLTPKGDLEDKTLAQQNKPSGYRVLCLCQALVQGPDVQNQRPQVTLRSSLWSP